MCEVLVYKNLRNGLWSIAAIAGNDNRGKLLEHRAELALVNARFVVKESRQKAIAAGGHREVHAWVIGTIAEPVASHADAIRVTYRPKQRAQFFRCDTGAAVHAASRVSFHNDGTCTIGG